MIRRIINLNTSSSLFLFGARATGKSTLLNQLYAKHSRVLWIDLLKDEDEEEYKRKPSVLTQKLATGMFDIVVIDEVQKNPKLLDIVHLEIEKKQQVQFILTGSSARKLKHGGANLLAGRAFVFQLFPLTSLELGESFNLLETLEFGSLPKLYEMNKASDKERYLKSYVKSYVKEEILQEQIVRKIDSFSDFLEVATQMSGKIINFSKIANDIGVDDKTVRSYYEILADTLIGFFLQPFHRSIRKRQREAPKFYLFDLGVKRAIANTLKISLHPGTSEYGQAFEHFLILEFYRLNEYLEKDFKLSYLRTKDNAEIDLVVERPGQPDLLVEVKSYQKVSQEDANRLQSFVRAWDKPVQAMILSQDPRDLKIDEVLCSHWQSGLSKIFDNKA